MTSCIKQYFRARTNHPELNSVAVLHNKYIWRHFRKVTVAMIFITKEASGKFGQAVQEQNRSFIMAAVRPLLVLPVQIWLVLLYCSSLPRQNSYDASPRVLICPGLVVIPERVCNLWIWTRDKKLHDLNLPPNHRSKLGLHLARSSHSLISLLLSGDICVNPGPDNPRHKQSSPRKEQSATCLVINAQSLKSVNNVDGNKVSNISRFQELVYGEEADIVFVTEAWLKDYVENIEILPAGYEIYRRDRITRAGGTSLAFKTTAFESFREITDFTTSDLEVVTVELTTKSKLKLLICCCYRVPEPEVDWSGKFDIFLSELSSRYTNILICEDFNLPKVSWESQENTTGAKEIAFEEQLADYFLTQLNTIPTRGNNLLDLVITSVPNQVNDICVLSPAESGLFTDHGTIVFQLETSKKAAPKQGRTVHNYKKGDFDGLRSAIEAIDLSNAIHQDDVNTSWLEWKDTFLAAVKDYIPTKRIKGRNSPPWINGGIVHALKRKEAVRKKLKKSPTDALKNRFRELRTQVKKMISASRTDFFNSLDADLSSNPKRFWSVFKLKSKNSRFPGIMSIGQRDGEGNQQARLATTPSSIASIFNDYFSSVFVPSTPAQPPPHEADPGLLDLPRAPPLHQVQLEVQDVLSALLALDPNKANGISCRLLKVTAQQIAPSLTQLYNLSLRLGVGPMNGNWLT